MPFPSPRLFLAALLSTFTVAAAAVPRLPLVTMLDGDATLLRDGTRFALAEGVRLEAGDLLATGAHTRLLRVEFPDGLGVAFGPGCRAMLMPKRGDDPLPAGIYLLSGWVKLAAPTGVAGDVRSPVADSDTTAGTLILSVHGDAAQAFSESGTSHLQPRAPASAQALKAGNMLVLAGGGARPVLASGASPAFVQAMPRAFRDSLPSRLDAFPTAVSPRRLGDMGYADAQPWIDAEPSLRRVFAERWRRLAADPQFRSGLVAGLKAHPEWTPILYPQRHASPGVATH